MSSEKKHKYNDYAYRLANMKNNISDKNNRFKDFKMPEKLIIGDSAEKLTNDSLPINQFNFNDYKNINTVLVNGWFLGYQEYSILSQNGLIQNIIQSYAQDCVREWIEIKSTSKDKSESKQNKINMINRRFEELQVRDKIKNAVELTIMYGGCKIYPKIRGDDSQIGGNEYLTPFRKEKMTKGDLLYLKVIEPLYATPIEFNATNPLSEDFYEPSTWSILSTLMHSSRLCHFVYNYVPTLLKPIYWFNGMPLIQLCLDYIMGFETVRQNVVEIAKKYNVNILKTNMTSLLNTDQGAFMQGADIETRVKIAQKFKDNFSIFLLNNSTGEEEEWQQYNMTLSGLDNILSQNAEYVCAVAQIPAIRLFGTSPKGFNSTGENELRIYYDQVRAKQMAIVQPPLQKIFEIVQIDLFGEIDDDLIFSFKPLWTESSMEIAQIQAIKKDINTAYVQTGILTSSEVRKNMSEDVNSGYSNLSEDFELNDEEEFLDEEEEISGRV